MLEEISSILWIIYVILLIFFMIIIITQLLYPNFSIWNYFPNNDNIKKKNNNYADLDDDDDKEKTDNESNSSVNNDVTRNYVKYNQEFKVKNLTNETHKFKSDKVTYTELVDLLQNDEFIEGYVDSIKTSLEIKLKTYNIERNNLLSQLKSYKEVGQLAINQNKDTHVEKLVIHEKSISDMISIINEKLTKASTSTVKKNFKNMVSNKHKGFASLVGRDEIKDFIAKQIYTFYKNPNIFLNDSQGILLLGNSGVGKTRVAKTISYIYSKSGILEKEIIIEKTPADLTSHYVNEDKKNTFKILLSSLGGVFFVDEAYGIVGTGLSLDRGHGEGVITEIVAFDTDHAGRFLPILAGYEKEMKSMMKTNQGLARRFPHVFLLEDYTAQQLTDILIRNIEKNDPNLIIDDKDANCIYTCVDTLYVQDKSIFSKQGSDMVKLASYILSSIYMSKNYLWERGKENFVNRAYLLTCGFNSYLESKGLMLTI